MEYGVAHSGDESSVKALWKTEEKSLGIPYNIFIKEYVDSGILFCIRDGDKLIGYCFPYVMKRKPIVRIEALVVDKQYRNRGYGKQLIHRCYRFAKQWIDNGYLFQAEAKEGVENNSFYDKISIGGGYTSRSQKKTCAIRTYTLDTEKIQNWNDEWSK